MEKIIINSPIGWIHIEGDNDGISKIFITSAETVATENIPNLFIEVVSQLKEYFEGKSEAFTFKKNLKGTTFQKKVWSELTQIPFGKTVTYKEIALRLNQPNAIRAVANANAKNPLWIAIPCHRVIGTNGSLTGYAGEIWRKKWLLEHENPLGQQLLF